MSNNLDILWDDIEHLLGKFGGDDIVSKNFRLQWRFVTDVDTNEIRPEAQTQAEYLLASLKRHFGL